MSDLSNRNKYCLENSNTNLPAPHEYTIPIEWAYRNRDYDLGNGSKVPATHVKIVTKLMCPCGKERKRET